MNNQKKCPANKQGLFSYDKDRYFATQMQIVFKSFSQSPKTMLMVAQETGIYRANICRYVREFKKNDRLFLVRKGICPISKHRAGFYTSNEDNIEFTYKDGFYIPNEDKNIVGYDQNKRHE